MYADETIIERVRRMELYFDTISRAVREEIPIYSDPPLKAVFDTLIEYYDSGQWLSDYQADERGELPHYLRRGVLSEDGVYNLLSEIQEKGENYMTHKEKANQYFSMLIYVLMLAGAILTVLGIALMKPISIWLGAEGDMINYCVTYGRCILISLIPFLLQNCLQSFFVVAEKPKMGLIISIAVGLTNIIFDTIFIYLLQMGIFGAALATAISQTVGGMSSLIYFIRKNDSPLYLTKAKFDGKAIIQTSINGSSEMATNVSLSLVNMLYNFQLMKIVGPNGVVAYGIIMYISFIFISTFIGYSLGSAPIISYHYGAGDKKELKNLLGKSLKLITITSIVMTVFAEIFAEPLASIFVGYDKELLEMTTTAIRIYSLSNLISGFNILASAFFTALNNGVISAIISFSRILIFQVAMIFILPAILGLNGIWLAIVVAEILAIILSGIFVITNQKKYGYM